MNSNYPFLVSTVQVADLENLFYDMNIMLYLLVIILLIVWMLLWVYIWFKKGKEYNVFPKPQSLEQAFPPHRGSPALIEYLVTQGKVTSNSFAATILYLIKHKMLEMKVVDYYDENTVAKKHRYIFTFKPEKALKDKSITLVERHVFNLLLRISKDGTDVTSDELVSYMKNYPEEILLFYRHWNKVIAHKAQQLIFFEPESRFWQSTYYITGFIFVIAISALLNEAGFFRLSFVITNITTFIIICLIVVYLAGKSLLRWSVTQARDAALWMGFKEYVSDVERLKKEHLQSLSVWGDILIYATALGEADKVQSILPLHMELKKTDADMDISDAVSSFISVHVGEIAHILNSEK